MFDVTFYPLVAVGLYLLYLIYAYINNVIIGYRTGFPTVHVPLWQQDHPIWMVLGPMSRPWLQKKLPTILYNRIVLTIYGVEFFQKNKPFEDYAKPQMKANPKLLGNGKSYVLVTSGNPEFWTADAEIAKEVLGRPNDFRQFEMASMVMNIFGKNVLTTDGAEWSRHRRIVAGAVTERVSPMVWSEAIRQTRALLSSMEKKSQDNGVDSNSTSSNDIFDMIKRIAIHVLYAAGMGTKQEFESSDAAVEKDKPKDGLKLTYIDAVKTINENTAGPIFVPTFLLSNWPSWLPGSKWLHEIGQAKVEFPQHTRNALKHERQLAAETGELRNNVMSALIAASERNENDPEKGPQKKGPALTDDELVGNLYIFTAAGFDTSANALSYALVLLARYPKWQNWLFEELDSLLPEDPDADFDYTSVFPKAHRAQAIMLEALRLFPPLIHVVKMTKAPQTVTTPSSGTFTIPTNTTIYINQVVLHTNPTVWRNLNMTDLERKATADDEDGIRGDEYEFRPSRWINPPNSSSPIFQPQKGTYLAWSYGPRVCPGQKMAQVEIVGILTTLFSRHRMEVVRKTMPVKGASDVRIPESDDALNKRLEALLENSSPKLTLEMDVYNVQPGEDRGLGLRWIPRK